MSEIESLRQTGRTTDLMILANQEHAVFLVHNHAMEQYARQLARKLICPWLLDKHDNIQTLDRFLRRGSRGVTVVPDHCVWQFCDSDDLKQLHYLGQVHPLSNPCRYRCGKTEARCLETCHHD